MLTSHCRLLISRFIFFYYAQKYFFLSIPYLLICFINYEVLILFALGKKNCLVSE